MLNRLHMARAGLERAVRAAKRELHEALRLRLGVEQEGRRGHADRAEYVLLAARKQKRN